MRHCLFLVYIVMCAVCHLPRAALAAEPVPASFGYVCRDAGAGGYQAFPDICRLSDGRLMVVFYAGYGHVSAPNDKWPRGGRISYCTSSDEGHSWSEPKILCDGPDDDRDPSIVQLDDGRLICNFFSSRKTGESEKAWMFLGTSIITSNDLGKSWSASQRIFDHYLCSSPIRKLSGGRLIMGLYQVNSKFAAAAVSVSDDGGKTWNQPVDIDNGGFRLDAETDVLELIDGTLYAVQRPQMCYSTSKDRGETWSVSKSIGFPGESPYLLRAPDGVIVLAFRYPQAHSTCLRLSRDECKTWGHNIVIDNVFGAYPSMVNLKDGSVLVVYHETNKGSSSAIRLKRFRTTRDGVEWLMP